MEKLLEGFSAIAGIAHFLTGSIASPSQLPPAELYAAAGAFALNVAALVWLRALNQPRPVEKPAAAEYDEAA